MVGSDLYIYIYNSRVVPYTTNAIFFEKLLGHFSSPVDLCADWNSCGISLVYILPEA